MFDSPAAAADALRNWFEKPGIEILVETLVPAIILHPSGGRIVIGDSRLGGTPDAAPGFEWPRPPAPINPDEIAGRGNEDAAREMRNHLARNLPYAFIGQVNLEKAARLGPVAASLPHEGRLLFFYDNMIGPWDTGTRVARVIWDRSPADALVSITAPKDLTKAAARERKEWAAMEAEAGTPEKRRAEKGTNYAAPARAVELQLTYRLPVPAALEYERFDDLSGARPGDGKDQEAADFQAGYQEALQEFHDQYPEEGWRRQQLLGAPMPEQDDPRLDAVVVTEFGKQHLARDEWLQRRAEIFTMAREWALLLQVDLGDWMRAPFVEGSVFFVIHRDDLKNGRFEKVVAVYQQT